MTRHSKTELTEDEAYTIGTWAYVYGYPVVKNLIVRSEATNPGFERYAPPNQFFHMRSGGRPEFTDMTPNVDTPYSLAWIDVTAEPVVLNIPALTDRYHVFQFTDFYIETFCNLGTRTTHGAGGDYAVVGPDWTGELPDGLTRIDAPTNSCWLQGRTLFAGPNDLDAMWAAQDTYRLEPLSAWVSGEPAPAAHEPEPQISADVVDSLEFFRAMNTGMTQNPPPERDGALVSLFARLGIGPDGAFDPDRADPAVASGLRRAIDTGVELIARQASEVRQINGWEMPTSNVGTYGTDFLQRARVAKYGYAGNVPEETVYANTLVDAAGAQLDGSNAYVLAFPAGELPPVGAFWSLTLYRWPEARLADNQIDRYSIGDRTEGLSYGADGSLEVVVSFKRPDSGTSNWLPAPDGPYWLIMRLYLPDSSVASGQYVLPALTQVS